MRDGDVDSAELEVSNSMTAAPEVLALSPDGTTKGQRWRSTSMRWYRTRTTSTTPSAVTW
jgi:hypothetical protein